MFSVSGDILGREKSRINTRRVTGHDDLPTVASGRDQTGPRVADW